MPSLARIVSPLFLGRKGRVRRGGEPGTPSASQFTIDRLLRRCDSDGRIIITIKIGWAFCKPSPSPPPPNTHPGYNKEDDKDGRANDPAGDDAWVLSAGALIAIRWGP